MALTRENRDTPKSQGSFKAFMLLLTALLVCGGYLLMHLWYDNRQHHYFDPFLQVYPDKFEVPQVKAANEYRILALGGSTTKDPRVPLEENYPAKLQEILRQAYPDLQVTVLNGGRDWYSSRHSLINYTGYGAWFRPDLVLVMHAINDVYRSFSPEKYARFDYDELYSHFYGASINGAEPPSFDRQLLKGARNLLGIDEKRGFREADVGVDKFVSLPSFQKNMERLGHYILSDSAELIFIGQGSLYNDTMIQPERWRIGFHHEFCTWEEGSQVFYPTYQAMHRAMHTYNATTRQVAANLNVPYVNADSALPRTLDFFNDDVHYTDAGSSRLAELVAETILEGKYLERKPGPWR